MADFNLIPASYEARLARLAMTRFAGAVCVIALVAGVLAYVSLVRWATTLNDEVAQLQAKQAVSSQQRNTITQLLASKKDLDQQWYLLENLRSGMPAKQLMESVQAALRENEVWFEEWRLRRAGIETQPEPTANQPGYFIIVKKSGTSEDWRSLTHMTVTGQAVDHSKLSEFAQRLLEHPDIEDVRVQRTAQSFDRDRNPVSVKFDLAIVLSTEGAQS
jgi:hypothetical protein